MRYRKRPVVIEAKRWDGEAPTATPIIDWILSEGGTARLYWPNPGDPNCIGIEAHPMFMYCAYCSYTAERRAIAIDTLDGTVTTSPGDWIVRGTEGEFYPVKPAAFDATFEPAFHEDR